MRAAAVPWTRARPGAMRVHRPDAGALAEAVPSSAADDQPDVPLTLPDLLRCRRRERHRRLVVHDGQPLGRQQREDAGVVTERPAVREAGVGASAAARGGAADPEGDAAPELRDPRRLAEDLLPDAGRFVRAMRRAFVERRRDDVPGDLKGEQAEVEGGTVAAVTEAGLDDRHAVADGGTVAGVTPFGGFHLLLLLVAAGPPFRPPDVRIVVSTENAAGGGQKRLQGERGPRKDDEPPGSRLRGPV
jgi:hypothetical protein